MRSPLLVVSVVLLAAVSSAAAEPHKVMALGGSSGSHRTAEMIGLVVEPLRQRGIEITYSEEIDQSLAPDKLADCAAVLIYKDDGQLSAAAEKNLVDYLSAGGGLVAVHCASHAFRNSDVYTELVGGRFHHHGHGKFRPVVVDAQHAITAGWRSFDAVDETYVHDQLARDNEVVMIRGEGDGYEPYSWVRRKGKGRVFYTALGHDDKTWSRPEFVDLLARAIGWTARRKPADEDDQTDLSIEEYTRRALTAEPPRPLSPADSVKRMHLPEGFRVELFAAEPDVVKPITMAEDERGRVWIVESVDYPNDVRPPFAGNDRIKICEDTDGDGRADKFTVFAAGLSIPTSLLPYRDGVIVALAPHIVFFRDANGDGVSDQREVLYTGFGRFDTHAVHSNFRWGFDNWIWATVGYSGGDVRAGGERHRFKQGVIRFKPDGSQLEVLTSTSNNTWGLGFRETGEAFVSTANNQHSVHLAIANRYYEQVLGWSGQGWAEIEDHKRMHPLGRDLRQVDSHGGYTAAAGQTIYTARQFPESYWDRAALVCEPTGHLVHVDLLSPLGSGYVARDGYNLLASDDPWTAPIETHVALDGSLWMIDWYNYIVRHNPTPPGFETGRGNAYVTPQRDKQHGRVYRIVYGDDQPARRDLAQKSAAELVAALASDNLSARLAAQRLLYQEKLADAAPRLVEQVVSHPESPATPHALHLLAGFGKLPQPALAAALRSPSIAARRAAVEVMPHSAAGARQLLDSGLVRDDAASVRLSAILALAELPAIDETAPALAAALVEPASAVDRWVPTAITSAASKCPAEFLIVLAGQKSIDEPIASISQAARAIAEHWARATNHDQLAPLLAALAAAPPNITAAIVDGLSAGWPADRQVALDTAGKTALLKLGENLPLAGELQLARLARHFGAGEEFQAQFARLEIELEQVALDESRDGAERIQAARQLAALATNEERLRKLAGAINARSTPDLAAGLLDALAQSASAGVASCVIEAWPNFTPAARRHAVAVLMRRPAWTEQLLAALEDNRVSGEDLTTDAWQQLVRRPDPKLAELAKQLSEARGRLPSPDRARVLAELLPLAEQQGDPALGRVVFEKNCAKCHRHGSLGAVVGPDLTGVAARPRAEILTEVLDPNRSVEGNYRQYVVSTTAGEVFTGLLVAETKTTVELLDAEARRRVIPRAEVDELQSSAQSLMPEGFEKLPRAELVALVEFLSAKGKYLPLSIGKAATAVSTRGMFYSQDNTIERIALADWLPRSVDEVPFQLVDPRQDELPNVILLNSPNGEVTRALPLSVSVPCHTAARRIHLLSGVSGWGYPASGKGTVSMIVRLHYADGGVEEHPLVNGVHFADYIRRVDVPESRFAFEAQGHQQVRYLAISPRDTAQEIKTIEFAKGSDQTAPLVLAVTVERPAE